MHALILHNVTTWADLADAGDTDAAADIARDKSNAKGLAIFRRMPHGNNAPIEPGDRLWPVGALDFPDADTVADACNAAFTAGNSPYEGDTGVTEYRTWRVRSLSVGDVVLVSVGETNVAFAVAGNGWQQIDESLAAYKVEPPLGEGVTVTSLPNGGWGFDPGTEIGSV